MKKLLQLQHYLSRRRSLHPKKALPSDDDGTFRAHPPSPLTLPSDGSSNGSLGGFDTSSKENNQTQNKSNASNTSLRQIAVHESTEMGILKIYEDLYYEHERMMARNGPPKKKRDAVWKKRMVHRQHKQTAGSSASRSARRGGVSSNDSTTSASVLDKIASFKRGRSSLWKQSQQGPKTRHLAQTSKTTTSGAASSLTITRVASNVSASVTEAFLSDDGQLSIASNEFEDRLSVDTPVFDTIDEEEEYGHNARRNHRNRYQHTVVEDYRFFVDDVSSVTSFLGDDFDDDFDFEEEDENDFEDEAEDDAVCGTCTANDLAVLTELFIQDATTCLGFEEPTNTTGRSSATRAKSSSRRTRQRRFAVNTQRRRGRSAPSSTTRGRQGRLGRISQAV